MPSPALSFSEDTETALLARWRAGDMAAAQCLLRRELQLVRCYFARHVPCQADAEDLAQRTLLASIDALPRFRKNVELSHFVSAIANKLLLRYRRDDRRARARREADLQPDAVQAPQPSAISWICHEDELQRLRSAFRGLPDDSAHLLHLRYWEERDTSEIARLLDVKPGAVRTRLHRARHEMKRVLVEMAEARGEVASSLPIGARRSSARRTTKKSVTLAGVGKQ